MIRWFAAVLGYTFFRFPGAILGFILGSIFDNMNAGKTRPQRRSVFGQPKDRVTPADFELNLLSLASLVIKADGTVNQTELDYVRQYFVQAYGKERANATFRVFNDVIKKREVSAPNVAGMLRKRMRYESRLQVIHFLFSIANADGHVSQPEVMEINRIGTYLGIQMRDFESIKAMFFKNPDSAYKILEIERTASISEIKKAYREMVKKYHPDKLQHMDDAYKKGAEEKFRKVQEAYEQLQKEKGF
ncbi:MAG: TerB family tellurite resistance protein [Flavobacteriaceae bacterium]|nr:TerB family tellurite resistance protein [Flavobacteriaceae bacterium]